MRLTFKILTNVFLLLGNSLLPHIAEALSFRDKCKKQRTKFLAIYFYSWIMWFITKSLEPQLV